MMSTNVLTKSVDLGGKPDDGKLVGSTYRQCVLLFPGNDDDSPRLASFRQELSEQIQFVLIRYPSWREMIDRYNSIDSIAHVVYKQVIAAVPSGEITAAGYSFGGVIGFEIMRRLVQQGRMVSVFMILDTSIERSTPVEGWRATVRRRVGAIKRLLLGADPVSRHVYYHLASSLTKVGREKILRWVADVGLRRLPAVVQFGLERHLKEAVRRCIMRRWVNSEQAEKLPSSVWLFRSEEHGPLVSRDLGWSALFETVKIIDVTGDHEAMLRTPHRAALCKAWSQILNLKQS